MFRLSKSEQKGKMDYFHEMGADHNQAEKSSLRVPY